MLTDAVIRRLKCREKPYKVADMYGLYLLMHPKGARYWRFDYRHAGKRGTLALGVYPEVSLKEAREKRANAGKMLDKGLNPSAYKKLTSGIASLEGGDSFKAVAMSGSRKSRLKDARRRPWRSCAGFSALRNRLSERVRLESLPRLSF